MSSDPEFSMVQYRYIVVYIAGSTSTCVLDLNCEALSVLAQCADVRVQYYFPRLKTKIFCLNKKSTSQFILQWLYIFDCHRIVTGL